MTEKDNPRETWYQINIQFNDRHTAERTAAARLGPGLKDAEAAGLIESWFYVRKGQWWRLRCLPPNITLVSETRAFVENLLRATREHGQISNWVENVYEPETHAFGGPEAMTVAHDLFHRDSQCVLDYLHLCDTAASGGPADNRKELSVLLCSTLMRAAGQDWYEQGDVWARTSDNRPAETAVRPEQQHRLTASVRRLMTVDTSPGNILTNGPLHYAADWIGAFERAGAALADLSRNGILTRGLRAVLSHHVIFHWNRLGLPYPVQAGMASAARDAVLGPAIDIPASPRNHDIRT